MAVRRIGAPAVAGSLDQLLGPRRVEAVLRVLGIDALGVGDATQRVGVAAARARDDPQRGDLRVLP